MDFLKTFSEAKEEAVAETLVKSKVIYQNYYIII